MTLITKQSLYMFRLMTVNIGKRVISLSRVISCACVLPPKRGHTITPVLNSFAALDHYNVVLPYLNKPNVSHGRFACGLSYNFPSTLKMEAIRSSETLVNTISTRCHIPEECFLQNPF
jgi:hypothetical protein